MILIIVDETLIPRAGVIQRMLHNFGLRSAIRTIQSVPEGATGIAVINEYDAAIVLQHETNQNSSGNKRIYSWVTYTPGDKPFAHFGCVNRLAGSSSGDYNTTLGALNPAFPIVRYNTADIPATSFPFSACTLAIPATGGTFTLDFGGQTTTALANNASSASIQSALETLSSVGAGNVRVRPIAGLTRTHDVVFTAPAITGLLAINTGGLTGGSGTVTAIETSGYRNRLMGTVVVYPDGSRIPQRVHTWRNGTNFGLFRVNPANLDANREVLLRVEVPGVTIPATAVAGVRYFNRYFLPALGTASNACINRAQHETSYDWLQTTALPLVLFFLEQAGIRPLFQQPVGLEHDHPIDDFTAVFPGTLAEQRARRRKNEYATYRWLAEEWCPTYNWRIQIGVNTGGRDQPRFVSSDPQTHWQALYPDAANNSTEIEYANLTNDLLRTSRWLVCNAHCHTREKGFTYSDYPRHVGGQYGVGNAFAGDRVILPTLTANDTILYPRRFTLAITATGGTYTLAYGASVTSALAFNASAATVQSALEGLASVGAGQVTVLGTPASFEIVFNNPASRGAFTIAAGGLTGGTGTLTSRLAIESADALRLHTERDLYEMLALGFGSLHGGEYHVNDARNAPGAAAAQVYLEYGIQSCRVADTKLQSQRFKQRGSEIGFKLWQENNPNGVLEYFATSSSSLDVGNKGLLTTGGSGGNDASANTIWELLVGVADVNNPSFVELQTARNRLLSLVSDRISFQWLIYGGIPYLHGSNSHAANESDPLADFNPDNLNFNAMREIHLLASQILTVYRLWFVPGAGDALRGWRAALRAWMAQEGIAVV